MSEVVVVGGAGQIGQAIAAASAPARKCSWPTCTRTMPTLPPKYSAMPDSTPSPAIVDVSDRASVHTLTETATGLGAITGLIHAAGVSPSQAPHAAILAVDLYGPDHAAPATGACSNCLPSATAAPPAKSAPSARS
ncbi:hypothetical protein NG2371_01193 [Nocardia gamkensis]|nr:hypothetical protein [Nocardia gamkensis]